MTQKTETENYYSDPDSLPDLPNFRGMIRWWRGLVRQYGRPSRAHVHFRDLQGWHSRLTISQALPDLSDLEMRLVGEDVSDLFEGHLIPGARLSRVIAVPPGDQRYHVQKLAGEGCIALTRGTIPLSAGQAITANALDFPLLGDEGPPQIITFYDFTLPMIFKHMPGQTRDRRERVV